MLRMEKRKGRRGDEDEDEEEEREAQEKEKRGSKKATIKHQTKGQMGENKKTQATTLVLAPVDTQAGKHGKEMGQRE